MNFAPFDVMPLVERLKTSVPVLRQVETAAEFSAVQNLAGFPAPCAYVVLVEELPQEKATGNAPRGQQVKAPQIVVVRFSVIYALRSFRGMRDENMVDDWKTVVGGTRESLCGFVPDVPGARPIEWLRGWMLDYDNTTMLWSDAFSTQRTT